jgi:hypothetical protein
MSDRSVTMVRVYLTEKDHQLNKMLSCLQDELKVCGVTVLRGIAGFGASGKLHSSTLLDMSLDLPLVVEFFDTPEKVAVALEKIHDFVGPGHVISWSAELNMGNR